MRLSILVDLLTFFSISLFSRYRLQVHLLTSWTDCVHKVKRLLFDNLNALCKLLASNWVRHFSLLANWLAGDWLAGDWLAGDWLAGLASWRLIGWRLAGWSLIGWRLAGCRL